MKILKESSRSSIEICKDKVFDVVKDKINDCLDNLAVVLSSEISEYNADWCEDEGIYTTATDKAIDNLALALVNEMFANHNGE